MAGFSETVIYRGCELIISGEYHKAHKGYRNSWGAPEEPDETECIEIEEVFYNKVNVIDLIDLDAVEELIWEAFSAKEPDYDC